MWKRGGPACARSSARRVCAEPAGFERLVVGVVGAAVARSPLQRQDPTRRQCRGHRRKTRRDDGRDSRRAGLQRLTHVLGHRGNSAGEGCALSTADRREAPAASEGREASPNVLGGPVTRRHTAKRCGYPRADPAPRYQQSSCPMAGLRDGQTADQSGHGRSHQSFRRWIRLARRRCPLLATLSVSRLSRLVTCGRPRSSPPLTCPPRVPTGGTDPRDRRTPIDAQPVPANGLMTSKSAGTALWGRRCASSGKPL